MDELLKLYSPSYWCQRLSSSSEIIDHHLKFTKSASNSIQENVGIELNIPYGTSDRTKFDIIGTNLSDDAPIFIFIHGGYWQITEVGRELYHFIAKELNLKGIKTISIGYDLCPDVTLSEIRQQICNAIFKCIDYAKNKKSRGLFLAGHSAGAHLVVNLFIDFFKTLPAIDRNLIKAAFLISGLYELTPLLKIEINDKLKLDEETARLLSPQQQEIVAGQVQFYVIVGEYESSEFIRQSVEFCNKLKQSNLFSQLHIIPKVDHYDIIENLYLNDFMLTKLIAEIIVSQ